MCKNPYKAFKYGETENGKDNYIICSYDTKFIGVNTQDKLVKSKVEIPFSHEHFKWTNHEYIEIPCGKCLDCRLRYSKLWADRCMLEAQQHEKNCFVTLTYDDLHIPIIKNAVNPITGEIQDYKTLKKRDLQLFLKKLRKELDKENIKIRFFASGEYSPDLLRPHYHMIIFGWCPDLDNPEEAVQVGQRNGNNYYSSSLIAKCWSEYNEEIDSNVSKGYNVVAPCTWQTCNYVARYVIKKYGNEIQGIYDTGIEKEFLTMSRRPGIGLEWFNTHKDCYATFLNQYLSTDQGSIEISPNRYFDSKLELEDPEMLEKIKERRIHFSEEKKKLKKIQSDLPYSSMLEIEADSLMKKTKILKKGNL